MWAKCVFVLSSNLELAQSIDLSLAEFCPLLQNVHRPPTVCRSLACLSSFLSSFLPPALTIIGPKCSLFSGNCSVKVACWKLHSNDQLAKKKKKKKKKKRPELSKNKTGWPSCSERGEEKSIVFPVGVWKPTRLLSFWPAQILSEIESSRME